MIKNFPNYPESWLALSFEDVWQENG